MLSVLWRREDNWAFLMQNQEDIQVNFGATVLNTPEDTSFVVQEGTNNIASGKSEEILTKYRDPICKFKESQRN